MTFKRFFIPALCLALALLAASCAPVAQPPIEPGGPILKRPITATYLLDHLQRKTDLVRDLKGVAEFSINAPDKDFSASQAALIKKPGMFRLETLSYFGNPVFYIVADGRNLNLFDPKERKLYIAEATEGNNFKIFGLRQSFDDLVTILLGGVPLSIESDRVEMRYFARQDQYLLDLTSKNGYNQKVWFAGSTLNILKSELRNGVGQVELKAEFTDFEDYGNFSFPSKIELSLPTDKARLKVNYSELKINEGLSDELFKLKLPNDLDVYLLK